ncbi:unnamed protein product [Rhizophagus irregularis]|nr:unnamed protein product [Rhizophagus irregularis]CAB4414492.1 unnamed protein product [Rhizophagus irregularis]
MKPEIHSLTLNLGFECRLVWTECILPDHRHVKFWFSPRFWLVLNYVSFIFYLDIFIHFIQGIILILNNV